MIREQVIWYEFKTRPIITAIRFKNKRLSMRYNWVLKWQSIVHCTCTTTANIQSVPSIHHHYLPRILRKLLTKFWRAGATIAFRNITTWVSLLSFTYHDQYFAIYFLWSSLGLNASSDLLLKYTQLKNWNDSCIAPLCRLSGNDHKCWSCLWFPPSINE